MSTLQKTNFEFVSSVLDTQRRDFPLADKTLANPLNAVALVDGEWVTLDDSSKLVRASVIGTPGNPASKISFPLWAERGRSDVQSLSGMKMPILFRGFYEADTRIFDATVALNGGAAITSSMQPLKVATITFSGRNFTGLVGHGALSGGDTDPIVGYVTKLPAINGGKLRFISAGRH
jgi:hypothetical protein